MHLSLLTAFLIRLDILKIISIIWSKINPMKKLTGFLYLLFFAILVNAQDAPVYDDMIFESDSMNKAYKPLGKNYVLVKSKRGTDGVPKTSSADSIKNMSITDIVLVFTENEAKDLAARPVANRERWENLMKTYPEFFKDNPNLFNMCQCAMGGDGEALKKTQGFYVYIGGMPEPAAAPEPKAVVKKEEPAREEKVAKAEKPKKEKVEKVKEEKAPKEEKVKEEKAPKEEKVAKAEKPKKEEKKEEPAEPKKSKKEKEEEVPVVKAPLEKRAGYAAPKKSKDVKACRPPCYESGGEEIYDFFKENLPLNKKQKKLVKDLVTIVRLQLNFDGTIKKIFVQGGDPEMNKLIEETIKNNMNTWYPAVKGGVTIKSEVRMTIKYDSSTKALRPSEINFIPKPAPKCACVPDSQLFDN